MRVDAPAAIRFVAGLTIVFAGAPALPGQTQVFVAIVGYEAPGVFLPGFLFIRPGEEGEGEWRLGIYGSAIETEWRRPRKRRETTGLTIAVTPWNAHSSRYIYVDGERSPDASYDDATFEIRASLERELSRFAFVRTSLLGLYDSVSGLRDSSVEAGWSAPFAGVGIAGEYRNVLSEDPIRWVWDGVHIVANAEAYGGKRFWWRGRAFVSAGVKLSDLHLMGRAFVFGGDNLDTVSSFLVGGPWEYPGAITLPGFRTNEFRVSRGVVLSGGGDLRIARGWDIGARFGVLESPNETAWGMSARLRRIWSGIGMELGAGVPDSEFQERRRGAYVFMGVSFGLLDPIGMVRRPTP